MDKPMTTEEFFNKINGILEEKHLLPDILDYGLATHDPVRMVTYEYDLRNNLFYGGSEGIYLDLWIEFYLDGVKEKHGLGTYKTLQEDDEGMRSMAKLLADFITTEYAYVNAHLDDFTWLGADVYPVKDNGERAVFSYTCSSMGRALKRKEEMLKDYPSVIVRDNRTRKETVFYAQEGEDNIGKQCR